MFFYIKKRYKENIFLLIIIILSIVLKLVSAFLTAEAFNGLISGDTKLFVNKVICCSILYIIYIVLFSFQSWYEVYVRQKLLSDIRKDIIHAFANSHINTKYSSDKMIGWLTTDINRINNEGYKNLYSTTEAIIDIIFSITALFLINWLLMIIIILLALLNLILPKLADNKISSTFQTLTTQQEQFISNMNNLFQGFKHLFSLNKQNYLIVKTHKEIDTIREAEINSYKIIGWATFLAALGNILGQIGSLIISGIFVSQKLLTFGDVLSVSTISTNIFNGTSNLSSSLIAIKSVYPIFDKYNDFFQIYQKEKHHNIKKIKLSHFTSDIILQNVSLSFDDTIILANLNYQFEKGKKYGIIGPSGSGKSTIFKLLNGSLCYDSGSISIDKQPVTAINGNALRSNITYIEQSPYLFKGTILENIQLDRQFPSEEINKVLKKVGLTNEIDNLPEGVNTIIGEGGVNLSGGQQQRISLARAIINGGSVLLSDESTSSLNTSLALSIEKDILTDKNYTIIMVSHHLSKEIEPYFDDILTLEKGKLTSQKL